MKTIDLNFNQINLNGTDSGINVGQQLATLLMNSESSGNALKLYGWATKLYAKEALELDDQDVRLFTDTVSKLKLPIWFEAAILKAL
jgi:hypothetical protein